jgi:hypothetical protein
MEYGHRLRVLLGEDQVERDTVAQCAPEAIHLLAAQTAVGGKLEGRRRCGGMSARGWNGADGEALVRRLLGIIGRRGARRGRGLGNSLELGRLHHSNAEERSISPGP